MLSDDVRKLGEVLTAVAPKLKDVDDLGSRIEAQKKALEEIQEQVSAQQKEFLAAKAQRDKDLASWKADIDRIKDEKARELAGSNSLVEAAKKKLADLESQINSKLATHSQIEASLDSLRKKIA